MALIDRLIGKLQRHPKRFVFADGNDPRVLQAGRQVVTRRMGVPILLGYRTQIKAVARRFDIDLTGMRLIDPERSDDLEAFAEQLAEIRRDKGMTVEKARELVRRRTYFATMMLAASQADALIAGATDAASSALRPLFQIIPLCEGVDTASSLLIIDTEGRGPGEDGVLFMADCSVLPDPTAEQLADIAVTTANVANHLTNALPRVAMLSFSTHGTSTHPSVVKVRQATELARERARTLGITMEIDGDIQVDAALDPATAMIKGVRGEVAGRANVLIFPDLNSANIGSKLVQIMAGANGFGQIITGLSRPAAEISRGASAHDIIGATAIIGCQAIDRSLLYGSQ
ncbi:MAG: phosphate acetyltransferase [Verrucomicrobia bacterium]|nr:MAG: phosphate acetyltransferase [Verrucomicrobiota bacterium]